MDGVVGRWLLGTYLASIVTYSRLRFYAISGALALHALDRQWLEQLRQIALSEQRLLASDRAAVHALRQRGFALLQAQDAFLNRALRHQLDDPHTCVWPMRCARSVAWFSTAGFHHES